MTSQDADYLRMQSPQASAIGAAAQQKVASVLLQISGVGGLGNSIAMHLASAGFRRISINDPQNLELDNLSRFPCATLANIGQPKAKIVAASLRQRGLEAEPVCEGNAHPSVDRLYQQADWI